jgi:hypothetical protein
MPRELTHWHVADSVFRALPYGPYKELLAEHYPLYLTGAVIYDSPWCSPAGFVNRQFYKGAREAHGMSLTNTWKPFERLFSAQVLDGPSLALTAGAITHLMTDASFHPAVYWFTGESSRKHFIMETVVDSLVRETTGGPIHDDFLEILELTREEWSAVAAWMTRFFGTGDSGYNQAKNLLMRHARIQSGLRKAQDLLARKGSEYRKILESPFSYRHPVTGTGSSDTLDSLLLKSVNRSLNVISGLFTACDEGWQEHFFGSLEPVSPLTGRNPCEGYTPRFRADA